MATLTEHKSVSPTKSNVPENWKKVDSFTENDMIDAFLQGKISEREEQQKILYKQFMSNFSLVTQACENMFQYLVNKSLNVCYVKLKIDSLTKFDAIILVDKNDYLSDKFSEIYTEALRVRKELKTKDIYLFLNFIPLTDNLSVEMITLDGYDLTYANGKNKPQAKTSRARKTHGEGK